MQHHIESHRRQMHQRSLEEQENNLFLDTNLERLMKQLKKDPMEESNGFGQIFEESRKLRKEIDAMRASRIKIKFQEIKEETHSANKAIKSSLEVSQSNFADLLQTTPKNQASKNPEITVDPPSAQHLQRGKLSQQRFPTMDSPAISKRISRQPR